MVAGKFMCGWQLTDFLCTLALIRLDPPDTSFALWSGVSFRSLDTCMLHGTQSEGGIADAKPEREAVVTASAVSGTCMTNCMAEMSRGGIGYAQMGSG